MPTQSMGYLEMFRSALGLNDETAQRVCTTHRNNIPTKAGAAIGSRPAEPTLLASRLLDNRSAAQRRANHVAFTMNTVSQVGSASSS
jgi:hypothetical protein